LYLKAVANQIEPTTNKGYGSNRGIGVKFRRKVSFYTCKNCIIIIKLIENNLALILVPINTSHVCLLLKIKISF